MTRNISLFQNKFSGENLFLHRPVPASCQERIFKPTTEAISVVMKSSRQKLAGSLKTRMPTRTVPTAPMPVHPG